MSTAEVISAEQWEANTLRRETGLIEHRCPHGIGHPNPGSALWIAEGIIARRAGEDDGDETTVDAMLDAWMVHGCDGCCRQPTFPGYKAALIHAHGLIREANANSLDDWRKISAFKEACLNAGVLVPGEIDREMLRRWRAENPPADFGPRYWVWKVRGWLRR